jgi:hypothetical protein
MKTLPRFGITAKLSGSRTLNSVEPHWARTVSVASCEMDGHLWNALGKCVMCGTPKQQEPTNLYSCPFCGSFEIKLFTGGDKQYAQCQNCTACGPDHIEGRHWNIVLPRRPPEGCYCPPDKCMAPVVMGRQAPCLRRSVTGTGE